jgi:hypothetical protein
MDNDLRQLELFYDGPGKPERAILAAARRPVDDDSTGPKATEPTVPAARSANARTVRTGATSSGVGDSGMVPDAADSIGDAAVLDALAQFAAQSADDAALVALLTGRDNLLDYFVRSMSGGL